MAAPSTEPAEATPSGGDPSRILTVPNLITSVRLLCLPVFVLLLFSRHDRFGAALLLAALGATDWCDGYVARHFGQESNFGRLLDPTADRLLFFVGVGSILIDGSAPRWFCVIVLIREVTVATITVVLTAMGVTPIHVTWFGKAGTFALMAAFPWFLAGSSDVAIAPVFTALAWIAGPVGIVASYYAAVRYVPLWRANLRAAREPTDPPGFTAQGSAGKG